MRFNVQQFQADGSTNTNAAREIVRGNRFKCSYYQRHHRGTAGGTKKYRVTDRTNRIRRELTIP